MRAACVGRSCGISTAAGCRGSAPRHSLTPDCAKGQIHEVRIFASAALLGLLAPRPAAKKKSKLPGPQPAAAPQQALFSGYPLVRPPRPHRFQISSDGTWVRTEGPGYPAYRYTYRGEIYGFLRPTLFTYGYEHEMQENGPFSLNGQWH